MAEISPRIEQFRKMATDDPGNELGHFSLGREYLDAGMYADAAESRSRVSQIDANSTRAYELLATALLKLGRREQAVEQLTRGVEVADQRGDLMPKNAMVRMLKELGAPVPELKPQAEAQPVGQGQVRCQRCN